MKKNCFNPFRNWRICQLLSFSLFFSILSAQSLAQTTVKGIVKDNQGNPMSGVTVSVKGTPASVATDASGSYSITVPGENSVLIFSFVGYAAKEEKVGNRTAVS